MMLLILGVFAAGPIASGMPANAKPGAAADAALDRWQGFIAEASHRFGVPEAWIRAVMRAESGGRSTLNGRPITSRAGAMGLMQVMPDTYEGMRRAHDFGPDPHDPHDNILAGAAHLRAMYDRYGYPGLFAAYNAGSERYDAYLNDGRPLPPETRAYLAMIAQTVPGPPSASVLPSGTRLFFTLRTIANAPTGDGEAPSTALFVPLTTVPDRRQ